MKYPSGEIAWVAYKNLAGDTKFVITSKDTREYYFLYECADGKLRKLGRAKSPKELEEKFDVHKKMREK